MNWTKDIEDVIHNLDYHHKNIRTQNALVKLLNNLDRVSIERIENIIDGNYQIFDKLFEEIKHGNQEHQDWLKNKIESFVKREKL